MPPPLGTKKRVAPRPVNSQFTAGEMVDAGGLLVRARWRRLNLETHVDKHPAGADEGCWAELVGRPGGRATPGEYETASYDAIDNAVVHFSCIDRDNTEVRQYFLDCRFVQTVTPKSPEPGTGLIVITSFHRHRGGQHRHTPREHLEPLEPRIWRLIDDLYNDRAGGVKKSVVIHKGEKP